MSFGLTLLTWHIGDTFMTTVLRLGCVLSAFSGPFYHLMLLLRLLLIFPFHKKKQSHYVEKKLHFVDTVWLFLSRSMVCKAREI